MRLVDDTTAVCRNCADQAFATILAQSFQIRSETNRIFNSACWTVPPSNTTARRIPAQQVYTFESPKLACKSTAIQTMPFQANRKYKKPWFINKRNHMPIEVNLIVVLAKQQGWLRLSSLASEL